MVIRNIEDFCEWLGTDIDHLDWSVYNYGAWITWNKDGIKIGSIVEGNDAEFKSSFKFPFNSKELKNLKTKMDFLTFGFQQNVLLY